MGRTRLRAHRGAAVLAVAGLVALVALLVPAGAAHAAPPAPALPGTRVAASADPARAPRIGTGRYLVAAAPRTTYLRLRRTTTGTTLHVGVEMIGRGGSVGEGFGVEVGTTPAQADCGSAVVFRPTLGESDPVLYAATSTWTSVADHPCTTARSLYLAIRPPTDPADVGRRLQIRVYEEPPVNDSSFSLLTTPSPEVWTELEPGEPRAVAPAHDTDAAPEVTDGTYAFTLRPGQDDFLALPVHWGDGVRVQLDTELPAAVDPADPGIALHLLGPLLDSADTGTLGTDPDIGPTRDRRAYRTGAMSEVVAYINRDSVDSGVSGAALEGMHYVALSYLPAVPSAGPLAVRLTIQVRPSEGSAPLYTQLPGVPPPMADSRLVDGTLRDRAPAPASTRPASAGISEDRSFPWLSVAAGLGAVVVVGGLLDLLLQLRRRRLGHYHGRHR